MSLSDSLAEARQLYAVLSDITQLLDEVDVKAKQSTTSYAELYNVIQDVFIILKEMDLPPEAQQAITVIHRLIVAMNSLRLAMLALDMALITSPAGMALAGLGFAVSLFTALGSIQSTIFMKQR